MATNLQRGVSLLNGAWDPALLLLLGQRAIATYVLVPDPKTHTLVVSHKCCDPTYLSIVCSIVV